MSHDYFDGSNLPYSSTSSTEFLHPREEQDYLYNLDLEINELERRQELCKLHQDYILKQRKLAYYRQDDQINYLYDAPHHYEQLCNEREASHSIHNTPKSFEAPQDNVNHMSLTSIRKRPNPWENDHGTKRYSDYEANFNYETLYGSRSGPQLSPNYFSPPMPLSRNEMQQRMIAPRKRNPANLQQPPSLLTLETRAPVPFAPVGYKANRGVSKPKVASARPNKLANSTVASRKDLIKQTVKTNPCSVVQKSSMVSKKSIANTGNEESFILLAGTRPSLKLKGRLDMALGSISKSVRDILATELKEANTIQFYNTQRYIKHVIRERIWDVMLGKQVGLPIEIVAAYREKYPLETDRAMVQAAFEIKKSNSKYRDADTAKDYIKLNMDPILMEILTELFQKIKKLSSGAKDLFKGSNVKTNDTAAITKSNNANNTKNKGTIKNNDTKDNSTEHSFTAAEFESLLIKKLPTALLSFLPEIQNITLLDSAHVTSVAEVIAISEEYKALTATLAAIIEDAESDKQPPNENISSNEENETNTDTVVEETTSINELLAVPIYFVKVIGHPTLPKKTTMQTFLNQFEPTSIKRHKKQHNLLFVGFNNKNNFDKALEKNGITIGNFTIEIKASERVTSKPQSEALACDASNNSANNEQDYSLFGYEINEQINDLLLSIKQAEENETTDEMLRCDDLHSENGSKTGTIIIESDDESHNQLQSIKVEDVSGNKSGEYINENPKETKGTQPIAKDTDEFTDEFEDSSDRTGDTTFKLEELDTEEIARDTSILEDNDVAEDRHFSDIKETGVNKISQEPLILKVIKNESLNESANDEVKVIKKEKTDEL